MAAFARAVICAGTHWDRLFNTMVLGQGQHGFLDTGFAMMNISHISSNTCFSFLLVRHHCAVEPRAPTLALPAALPLPACLPPPVPPYLFSGGLLRDTNAQRCFLLPWKHSWKIPLSEQPLLQNVCLWLHHDAPTQQVGLCSKK